MANRQRIDELSFALLELVRGRNRCLESLVRAAESFLNESEVAAPERFQEALDVYGGRRDTGIRSYVLFDRHASDTAARLGELRGARRGEGASGNIQEPVKAAIEGEVERTTALMSLNAELDARVVSRIEDEKRRIVDEARRTRRSKERLARFRSEWVPPTGDEVDRKL